jgi:hypothetical protein
MHWGNKMTHFLPKLGLLVLASVLASGCATSYQAKSFTGGFSETALSPDTFKINFSGNGFTSAERASDFAILRAADKSLAMGCNYFSVMNENDSASVGSVSIGSGGWGHRSVWATSTTMPVVKPNSSLLVKCFLTQQAGTASFDANFIAQSIREKYHIKSDGATPAVIRPSVPSAPVAQAQAAAPLAPATTGAPQRPANNSTDIATMVLAAQKTSSSLGCGDVHSSGGSTFQASCTESDVVIDCDGAACRPVHSVRR